MDYVQVGQLGPIKKSGPMASKKYSSKTSASSNAPATACPTPRVSFEFIETHRHAQDQSMRTHTRLGGNRHVPRRNKHQDAIVILSSDARLSSDTWRGTDSASCPPNVGCLTGRALRRRGMIFAAGPCSRGGLRRHVLRVHRVVVRSLRHSKSGNAWWIGHGRR